MNKTMNKFIIFIYGVRRLYIKVKKEGCMRWMLFIGVGVLTYGSIICAEGINVEGKPVPPLAIRDLTVKINGDAHVLVFFNED